MDVELIERAHGMHLSKAKGLKSIGLHRRAEHVWPEEVKPELFEFVGLIHRGHFMLATPMANIPRKAVAMVEAPKTTSTIANTWAMLLVCISRSIEAIGQTDAPRYFKCRDVSVIIYAEH